MLELHHTVEAVEVAGFCLEQQALAVDPSLVVDIVVAKNRNINVKGKIMTSVDCMLCETTRNILYNKFKLSNLYKTKYHIIILYFLPKCFYCSSYSL